jgi:hypothetical protein
MKIAEEIKSIGIHNSFESLIGAIGLKRIANKTNTKIKISNFNFRRIFL